MSEWGEGMGMSGSTEGMGMNGMDPWREKLTGSMEGISLKDPWREKARRKNTRWIHGGKKARWIQGDRKAAEAAEL